MGEAILASLIKNQIYKSSEIGVFEADGNRRKKLKSKFKITSFSSNTELVQASEIVLLAVKPQQMAEVLEQISPFVTQRNLILSIAAGLDTSFYSRHLPAKTRVIRIMPNLCVMIRQGASGLFAGKLTTKKDKAAALKIFSSSGFATFVDREELLDSVTAVSGSGPAFVYLFLESLISAGCEQGLSKEMSRKLVLQTVSGATAMAEASVESLSEMISKVASKGGTTEAGLKTLENLHFRDAISKTIEAAATRAKELRCIS